MYCTFCGASFTGSTGFCTKCGTQVSPGEAMPLGVPSNLAPPPKWVLPALRVAGTALPAIGILSAVYFFSFAANPSRSVVTHSNAATVQASLIVGTWKGNVQGTPAELVLSTATPSNRLVGHITYGGIREQVAPEIESDGTILLKGTGFRRLSGKGSFSLDTFTGTLSSDSKSMRGSYSDGAGHHGNWVVDRQ